MGPPGYDANAYSGFQGETLDMDTQGMYHFADQEMLFPSQTSPLEFQQTHESVVNPFAPSSPGTNYFQGPKRPKQERLERRDDEIYKCTWPGCSHKSSLMSESRKHFQSTHRLTETRPHGCPHCETRFIWPKDVRRHIKQKHKDKDEDKDKDKDKYLLSDELVSAVTGVGQSRRIRIRLSTVARIILVLQSLLNKSRHTAENVVQISEKSPGPTWLEESLPSPLAVRAPKLEVPAPSLREESDSDNDSIFAESVFSQGSLASSATTASIASVSDAMIQDFVSILFCTDDLREISACAINDEAMGAQRYQRNIRRLITQYGRSLASESVEGDQAGAAKMLQSRSISTRAARDIVKQAERSNDGLSKGDLQLMTAMGRIDVNSWMDRQDQDDLPDGVKMTTVDDSEKKESDNVSEESVEDQEDIGAERYDVRALQEFLLQSKAYSEFKDKLVEFVHRSYESRVLRAIGTEITPEDGKHCLGREGIRAVAKDLSWAPVRLISISNRHDCGIGDYVKGWVEDKVGETWNWWPLQQVKRPLASASSRVRWQSPFGTPRYVDIPTCAAKALQLALSSAPAFVNSQNTSIPAQTPPNQTRNGNAVAPAQSANSGSISGTGKHTGSQQHQGTASPGCGSASSLNGQVSQIPQAPDPRHVFLCVRRGTSHSFVDMSTHTMRCDGDFFRALKENYFHLRGWLRRYFSMWQYDRCDFYQFQKFDINKGAPSKESFPPSSNAAYDFLPRPIDPSPPGGPISDQEFRDRFYKSCHQCHSWHLHHRERIRNTSTIQHAAKDAIALLPKRKEALQMDDGRREQFWGIFARERRCFAWVLAYGLLFNLPGVIFFFLWLFQWQHASDLQNAAVPVGMSISLTMLFVALLFESREKDRM